MAKKNKEEYDAQDLYLASVQCPEADVAFFEKVFKKHADRPMRYLREDFCGTAALCAEWVKQHPENRAIGVDYHEPTLDWGRRRILPLLDEDQRNRIELVCDDVRHVVDTQADLLCAQNFSYWIFSERQEMKRYLEIAKQSIVEDGLLVLDLLGGTESTSVDTEERKVDDGTKVDGIESLQDSLMKQEDLFLKCIAGKMLTYAIGRELGVADLPYVDEAIAKMKENDYTLRSLIHYIATSKPFLTK